MIPSRQPKAPRRDPGLAALAVVAAIACSCSLFEPRTPEDPGGGGSFWQYPSAPWIVVNNVDGSLEARSITLYMTSLDTSFVFVPDAADSVEFGGFLDFSSWDYADEQNTITNLFAQVAAEDSVIVADFSFVEGYPDPPAPTDSATIWRDYEIVIVGSGFAEWGNPLRGRARITLTESSTATWAVSLWEDFRPDDYTPGEEYTWGYAKASYR